MSIGIRQSLPTVERQLLENRLAELLTRLQDSYQELNTLQSAVQQNTQKLQIDRIKQEAEKVEKQLSQLERSQNPDIGYENDWNQKIHILDFKQATKIFNDIFEKFEDKEGAFIFLLKNSSDMGGDWCIKKLKESFKARTWSVAHEIQFGRGDTLDQNSFLSRLGGHLGFSISVVDLQELTNQIIDKISMSIEIGSINFIELKFHSRALQKGFLEWLINIFWHQLVCKLEVIAQEKPLFKFIGIVSIQDNAKDEAILNLPCCTNQEFDCRKLLELPLENWTETEIKNWLITHSGLMLAPIKLELSKVNIIANAIHADSDEGKPKLVFKSLLEELETITKNLSLS